MAIPAIATGLKREIRNGMLVFPPTVAQSAVPKLAIGELDQISQTKTNSSSGSGLTGSTAKPVSLTLIYFCGWSGSQSSLQTKNPSHLILISSALCSNPHTSQMAFQVP